ncbi:MAG: cell wall hydrolase [Lachnospiraceae bacterium]|nr:cell wall hydrolase [Lachnospiraceae bacterium]
MLTHKRILKFITAVLTAAMVVVPAGTVFAEEIPGVVQVSDYLNVRAAADEDAEIIKELHNGDKVTVVGEIEGWYRVTGEHDGWVCSRYVVLVPQTQSGEAGDQSGNEPQQDQQQQTQQEQQNQQQEQQNQQQEQQNQQAEAAPTESGEAAAEPESNPQEQNSEENSDKAVYDPSNEDMRLLAALIQCECGSGSYEGKLAVGAVVMNRAKVYGGIREAIYAPYQFGPARSGKLDATLALNSIDPISMQAAADAMSGISNIGLATHFRNVNSGHAGIVAGNHVFW